MLHDCGRTSIFCMKHLPCHLGIDLMVPSRKNPLDQSIGPFSWFHACFKQASDVASRALIMPAIIKAGIMMRSPQENGFKSLTALQIEA